MRTRKELVKANKVTEDNKLIRVSNYNIVVTLSGTKIKFELAGLYRNFNVVNTIRETIDGEEVFTIMADLQGGNGKVVIKDGLITSQSFSVPAPNLDKLLTTLEHNVMLKSYGITEAYIIDTIPTRETLTYVVYNGNYYASVQHGKIILAKNIEAKELTFFPILKDFNRYYRFDKGIVELTAEEVLTFDNVVMFNMNRYDVEAVSKLKSGFTALYLNI